MLLGYFTGLCLSRPCSWYFGLMNIPGCTFEFRSDSLPCLPAFSIEEGLLYGTKIAAFWCWSKDIVVVFVGGLLSRLVPLKLEAALILTGNPCLQMSGNTAVPLCKVRDAVGIPSEGKTLEDVIN